MEKKFGFVSGLLLCTLVALGYFLFCPHAGRNGRTIEVHMHVIPVDVPRVNLRPHGELPPVGNRLNPSDDDIKELDNQYDKLHGRGN